RLTRAYVAHERLVVVALRSRCAQRHVAWPNVRIIARVCRRARVLDEVNEMAEPFERPCQSLVPLARLRPSQRLEIGAPHVPPRPAGMLGVLLQENRRGSNLNAEERPRPPEPRRIPRPQRIVEVIQKAEGVVFPDRPQADPLRESLPIGDLADPFARTE